MNARDDEIAEWLAQHPNEPHPDDLEAVAEHAGEPLPDIAVCVGVFRGEVLGPFRTPHEAQAALDQRIAETGEPITPGMDCGAVVFVDPSKFYPAQEGSLNG